MSRYLRDAVELPDFQTGYLGYYADHILSVGGLLAPYVSAYPSGYFEIEYISVPVGFTGNTDGTYTYAGAEDTVTFNLYVDDTYIDQYEVSVGVTLTPSARRRHRSSSGSIGVTSSSTSTAPVS